MQTLLPSRWIRWTFVLTLFFSALTGFAQMPIYKRYYIADLPGLGWLAEFYVTHALHYISAIGFIAITAYLVTDFWLAGRKSFQITLMGYVRAIMLALILVSGVLLVFRNLPGHRFEPEIVMAMDFSHLGLVILFLITSLFTKIWRKGWIKQGYPNKRW
jgi:hypothetical protein